LLVLVFSLDSPARRR